MNPCGISKEEEEDGMRHLAEQRGYIPEGGVWTAAERALDFHDAEEWPRAEATVAALMRALEDAITFAICDDERHATPCAANCPACRDECKTPEWMEKARALLAEVKK